MSYFKQSLEKLKQDVLSKGLYDILKGLAILLAGTIGTWLLLKWPAAKTVLSSERTFTLIQLALFALVVVTVAWVGARLLYGLRMRRLTDDHRDSTPMASFFRVPLSPLKNIPNINRVETPSRWEVKSGEQSYTHEIPLNGKDFVSFSAIVGAGSDQVCLVLKLMHEHGYLTSALGAYYPIDEISFTIYGHRPGFLQVEGRYGKGCVYSTVQVDRQAYFAVSLEVKRNRRKQDIAVLSVDGTVCDSMRVPNGFLKRIGLLAKGKHGPFDIVVKDIIVQVSAPSAKPG